MRLYKENGDIAGLDDVIKWFNSIYPKSIFREHPIAIVRGLLNAIKKNILTWESLQRESEE